MGHVRHHALVITSSHDAIYTAWAEARRLSLPVSEIVSSPVNGYRSFMVAPGGSKTGWEAEEQNEANRNALVQFLTDSRYSDGSSSFEWVEIRYGSDDKSAKVERSEWKLS